MPLPRENFRVLTEEPQAIRLHLVDHVGELDMLLVALKDAWKIGDDVEARQVISEATGEIRVIADLLARLQ